MTLYDTVGTTLIGAALGLEYGSHIGGTTTGVALWVPLLAGLAAGVAVFVRLYTSAGSVLKQSAATSTRTSAQLERRIRNYYAASFVAIPTAVVATSELTLSVLRHFG